MATTFGSLCLRCAQHGRTCCQRTEIYVTPQDVQRIRDAAGGEDFFEYCEPGDPGYTDQSDDPPWQIWVVGDHRRRRVLKHDNRGNCVFLTDAGCRLPLEVRPLICRLHPHLYNYQGLYPEISSDCPRELLQPQERLDQLILGFDRENAIRWHHMLYDEIQQEGNPHENRIDLRFA